MGLFDRLKKAMLPSEPEALSVTPRPGDILSPATGRVEPMAMLPDPVFAGGTMGLATGVWPEEGVAYAPASGTLTIAMPHAFGIVNDEMELLVHVGVDTVEMNGKGFEVLVEKGQKVEAGQPLVTFDRDMIAEAGYPDIIITIVMSTADIVAKGGSVSACAEGRVEAGAALMHVSS